MSKAVDSFYSKLRDFTDRMNRIRSKTISTHEFKNEAIEIYETWMTKIRPTLTKLHVNDNSLSRVDDYLSTLDFVAKERVAKIPDVKDILHDATNSFFKEIILNLRTIETPEPTEDMMESASFLSLDTNWSVATCALQLQEVSVILVAKRKNIELDKPSVEKILRKKIKDLTFNEKYEAFSQEVKGLCGVDMPILTMHLRKMRTAVLHDGYNPKPEEKDSLVSFTIGLLKKLEDIFNKT